MKKEVIKHFGGGCKGAAPLCFAKENFLFDRSKMCNFIPFLVKIPLKLTPDYWEKNAWLGLGFLAVDARGKRLFDLQNFVFDRHKICNLIPLFVKNQQ